MRKLVIVVGFSFWLLVGCGAESKPAQQLAESPKASFASFRTALSVYDDGRLREVSTPDGYRSIKDALSLSQLGIAEHPSLKDIARRRAQSWSALPPERVEWRRYGSEYAAVDLGLPGPGGDSVLFKRTSSGWKVDNWCLELGITPSSELGKAPTKTTR